jgi:hypothetical protein
MKQLRKIILLATAAGIILSYSCDKEAGHEYISIVNNTEKDICYQIMLQTEINIKDTIFQCHKIPVTIPVNSAHSQESAGRAGGWERHFKSIRYVQFLIMDRETFFPYLQYYADCDTIRKYVPILHRYQLTLEDLQRMNWTVVYPPEE